MLEQYGGVVDEDFLNLLSEDHREVLREGEYVRAARARQLLRELRHRSPIDECVLSLFPR